MENENKDTVPVSGIVPETKVAPENKDQIDYKAELDKKTKELEQAQFNIVQLKKNKKEIKAPVADEDDSDESSKVSTLVDEKLEAFTLTQIQDKITEGVQKLSANADEQALIKFHFENSIRRTGDTKEAIEADLRSARLLANAPRFEKLSKEIEAKRLSDTNVNGVGGSGGHSIEGDTPANTEALSAADLKFMKQYGLKPEDIKK